MENANKQRVAKLMLPVNVKLMGSFSFARSEVIVYTTFKDLNFFKCVFTYKLLTVNNIEHRILKVNSLFVNMYR